MLGGMSGVLVCEVCKGMPRGMSRGVGVCKVCVCVLRGRRGGMSGVLVCVWVCWEVCQEVWACACAHNCMCAHLYMHIFLSFRSTYPVCWTL